MERMCAWCGKHMGITPAESPSESVITHGICRECANKIYAARSFELTSFLDRLDVPVLVVDENGDVQAANKQARMFLGKEFSDIVGYQGGDVFSCAYAKLPQGCGNTVHCSGCTIRNTVMDTMQSGISHSKIQAYLKQGMPDDCVMLDLLISTEKFKGVVLLRIDKVGGNDMAGA